MSPSALIKTNSNAHSWHANHHTQTTAAIPPSTTTHTHIHPNPTSSSSALSCATSASIAGTSGIALRVAARQRSSSATCSLRLRSSRSHICSSCAPAATRSSCTCARSCSIASSSLASMRATPDSSGDRGGGGQGCGVVWPQGMCYARDWVCLGITLGEHSRAQHSRAEENDCKSLPQLRRVRRERERERERERGAHKGSRAASHAPHTRAVACGHCCCIAAPACSHARLNPLHHAGQCACLLLVFLEPQVPCAHCGTQGMQLTMQCSALPCHSCTCCSRLHAAQGPAHGMRVCTGGMQSTTAAACVASAPCGPCHMSLACCARQNAKRMADASQQRGSSTFACSTEYVGLTLLSAAVLSAASCASTSLSLPSNRSLSPISAAACPADAISVTNLLRWLRTCDS
jgi:hypothetical protein